MANMAFITGETNRRISNRNPEIYLEEIVSKQGEEALSAQCVPLNRDLWKLDRYRDFLDARRTAIAEQMNEFINKKAGISQ